MSGARRVHHLQFRRCINTSRYLAPRLLQCSSMASLPRYHQLHRLPKTAPLSLGRLPQPPRNKPELPRQGPRLYIASDLSDFSRYSQTHPRRVTPRRHSKPQHRLELPRNNTKPQIAIFKVKVLSHFQVLLLLSLTRWVVLPALYLTARMLSRNLVTNVATAAVYNLGSQIRRMPLHRRARADLRISSTLPTPLTTS
jgi:hypothetical protein